MIGSATMRSSIVITNPIAVHPLSTVLVCTYSIAAIAITTIASTSDLDVMQHSYCSSTSHP